MSAVTATAESRLALRDLIARKSLVTGREMTLVSGASSRFYFDMKQTTFDPQGARLIADLVLDALDEPWPSFLSGLEMGALPVVTAAVMRSGQIGRPITGFGVRKAAKDYGTRRRVERELPRHCLVAVVEDVTTTGGSAMQAVQAIRDAGGTVKQVITLVDRLQGAGHALAQEGLRLTALFDANDFDLGGAPV